MSKIFFGTDGWRARIDEEIHPESVAAVAQAFAAYVLKEAAAKPKVAIGYDTRRRSRDFAELFARVLNGNGTIPPATTALSSKRLMAVRSPWSRHGR